MSKRLFYRNSIPVNGVEVDALWEKKGELFELVDEDYYATAQVKEHPDDFYEVEIPEEAQKHL